MRLDFLSTALRDRNVGALTPTTYPAVRRICQSLPWDRPIVMVEYGPGTGAFTRYLQHRLHPKSTIVAIELNGDFAKKLEKKFAPSKENLARVVVAHGDAQKVGEILTAQGVAQPPDAILSGIPFSFLDESLRDNIIRISHDHLGPGGQMIVYQYSFLMRDLLNHHFGNIKISRARLNLPWLCVMRSVKASAPTPASN